MSKKEKLLRKLCATPVPRDFAWDELVTLMERAGFSATCTGGSHYMFEHVTGYRFRMSRTHPGGILKVYQVRDALEALRRVGEYGE